MDPIVKICGLSTEETVEAAVAAGADMVGLVLFGRSPRQVTVARAAELARRARGRAEIVALTVDMDDGEMAAAVEAVRPDWLQLHGAESVERVAAVREAFAVKVMKALSIATSADLDRVAGYAAVSDRLLFDARPPKDADRPGGHGRMFDWRILAGFAPGVPWLVSGGLTPGNVAGALALSCADGVDVSSGVETAPGRKDRDLIRAFVAAARGARVAPSAARVAS